MAHNPFYYLSSISDSCLYCITHISTDLAVLSLPSAIKNKNRCFSSSDDSDFKSKLLPPRKKAKLHSKIVVDLASEEIHNKKHPAPPSTKNVTVITKWYEM